MADYQFERQSRTPTSEQYVVSGRNGDRIGRVDLHYGHSIVYGLSAVEEKLTEDEILDLIDIVDEELVSTADVPRDDFVVAVYQGREVGVYSDELFEQDDLEEES